MMTLLSKLLLWWGATILVVAYIIVGIAAAADAYSQGGVGGLVVALGLISAVPSLVLGVLATR